MTAGLETLDAVLEKASRVRLTESGGHAANGEVVVDLSGTGERDRLRAAMAVEALPGFECMCWGDVRFEFLDSRGTCLAVVVLHHGVSLRWDRWEGDALLTDGRGLLRWLDEHGLPGPLRQADEDATRRRQADAERADWVAAMPPALNGLAERMLELSQTGGTAAPELPAEAGQRLSRAVPDPVDRVLQVLAWCGAGSGRCSGLPVHEGVPGLLLTDVPIAEIIAGLQDPRADERHFAGALRHLVGWKSRRKQQRDIDALPAPVTERLRQAAQESDDADKRSRAERWLTRR